MLGRVDQQGLFIISNTIPRDQKNDCGVQKLLTVGDMTVYSLIRNKSPVTDLVVVEAALIT